MADCEATGWKLYVGVGMKPRKKTESQEFVEALLEEADAHKSFDDCTAMDSYTNRDY